MKVEKESELQSFHESLSEAPQKSERKSAFLNNEASFHIREPNFGPWPLFPLVEGSFTKRCCVS